MVWLVNNHGTPLKQKGSQRGLTALLVAQFMGAANDNILKTILGFAVVTGGIWEGKLGEEGGQGLIALCLFVPFILFSGWAGPVADKFSKKIISVSMKWFEIPIAMMAGVGFVTNNFWLAAVAMILLATQSTFFSPAKYGMIPEIVPKENVSRANGILNMTTNVAIIVGILVGGIVSDFLLVESRSTLQVWLPGIVLTSVAVFGVLAIVWLPSLTRMKPKARIPVEPFSTYIRTGKDMCASPLILIASAWALFYLLATVVLLVITEYGKVLDVSDSELSYLLASIGIAVGGGSLLAGFVSKGAIRLGISKIAPIGMVLSLSIASVIPQTYLGVLLCLVILGVSSGLFVVPLQSLMQMLPTQSERGRVLATSNAISFSFMAIGSLFYWLLRPLFGDSPEWIFLICSGVALLAWFVTVNIHLSPASTDTMQQNE